MIDPEHMTVFWFRDGRPVTDPQSLRRLIFDLMLELEEARREFRRGQGLPSEPPRLYLVEAADEPA